MPIELSEASITITQDGNTLGTTDTYEDLTIRMETQLPGEGAFFVIKSDSGWSFNDIADFTKTLKSFEKAVTEYVKNLDG